jgi:hypothetical protein
MIVCECYKCSGKGHIAAFSGIANGVCFRCKGKGTVTLKHPRKTGKYVSINAMHCTNLFEAQRFRLTEFAKRFPELVDALNHPENEVVKHWIENGMGKLKELVEKLEAFKAT